MDELDLLISKWGTMKLRHKVLLIIIIAGPILFTANQAIELSHQTRGTQVPTIHINVSTIAGALPSATHNNLSNEELKNQTKVLTNQIFNFIGDRERTDPTMNNRPLINRSDFNTSQGQKEWNEYGKQLKDYNDETVTIYHMKYLPDVVRLKQEFKKHNLTDPELDSFDSLQVNSIGIEITAERLLELANKLP
jgi:hypothetical protein